MITAFYAGILGIWLSYLYLTVVQYRREYHVGLGDGDKEDLHKAIRIHGNFIETVPYVLLLMVLMEMMNPQPWLLHVFGVMLVVSRILHFLGLRKSSGVSPARTAAGFTTIGLIIAGSALLLWKTVAGGAVFTL